MNKDNIVDILLYLNLDDFNKICQTSKDINKICIHDDRLIFKHNKVKQHIDEIFNYFKTIMYNRGIDVYTSNLTAIYFKSILNVLPCNNFNELVVINYNQLHNYFVVSGNPLADEYYIDFDDYKYWITKKQLNNFLYHLFYDNMIQHYNLRSQNKDVYIQ